MFFSLRSVHIFLVQHKAIALFLWLLREHWPAAEKTAPKRLLLIIGSNGARQRCVQWEILILPQCSSSVFLARLSSHGVYFLKICFLQGNLLYISIKICYIMSPHPSCRMPSTFYRMLHVRLECSTGDLHKVRGGPLPTPASLLCPLCTLLLPRGDWKCFRCCIMPICSSNLEIVFKLICTAATVCLFMKPAVFINTHIHGGFRSNS